MKSVCRFAFCVVLSLMCGGNERTRARQRHVRKKEEESLNIKYDINSRFFL